MKEEKQKLLSKELENYKGDWVALSPDYERIVSGGETLNEVESKLKPEDLRNVIFYKVPPFDSVFIPSVL